MELSQICIRQILIMFILVGVGFFCGKARLIDKQTNAKLSSFVLEIVNPVLIFMSYQKEYNTELLMGLGLALLLGFASYGIMFAVLHFVYRDNQSDTAAVEKFAAVYSNCAFMGIPLINGLFGSDGVFYLTGYVTVFNVMVWTHGVMSFGGKNQKTSIKKVLMSPSIVAIGLGLVTFLLQIRLPGMISSAAEYISGMNTPLAMICAGVTISGTELKNHITDISVYRAALLRLIVCPLLFWAAFTLFPIPQTVFMVVLVSSGCPAAATGTMFALRYNKCPEMAAVIFAVTTLLSAITLPLMVMLGEV